ncbi:MAG: TIGR02647 family protein [Saccharospirillum sp.]|nr:TIGR02647 family protein [Saccharospirillum sp.]
MPFSVDHLAELNLLTQFPMTSQQAGLKVHSHEADPALVAAAQRLHEKGLISQKDGGYLTPLGSEALELSQKLAGILS